MSNEEEKTPTERPAPPPEDAAAAATAAEPPGNMSDEQLSELLTSHGIGTEDVSPDELRDAVASAVSEVEVKAMCGATVGREVCQLEPGHELRADGPAIAGKPVHDSGNVQWNVEPTE